LKNLEKKNSKKKKKKENADVNANGSNGQPATGRRNEAAEATAATTWVDCGCARRAGSFPVTRAAEYWPAAVGGHGAAWRGLDGDPDNPGDRGTNLVRLS